MSDQEDSNGANDTGEDSLRQARITTKTSDEMSRLLHDRQFEIVGRGPHEAEDGTYFVDIIADESELKKLLKGDWDIDIREPRVIEDAAGQLSETNRYAEGGAVPRGVGTKETR